MSNLNFSSGYKTFTINGDENAVIRVKTTDFSLPKRLTELRQKIRANVSELEKIKENEQDVEKIMNLLDEADRKTKRDIDETFGSNVSAVVFGISNCLSFSDGMPVALNFLNAIIPEITSDVEKEQKKAQQKISKYTDAAKRFK